MCKCDSKILLVINTRRTVCCEKRGQDACSRYLDILRSALIKLDQNCKMTYNNAAVIGVFSIIFICLAENSPNFVLILTDDQDLLLNGMLPMNKTVKLVGNTGKTFQNAFVNTPICCPSRSSILSGKYASSTQVFNNSFSGGCSSTNWQENYEPLSIAAILKKLKNYVTFYGGKYLNKYGTSKAGGVEHIPVGYDWWTGLKGNSKYYNYTLSVNGTAFKYENVYLTDLLANFSLTFLDNRPRNRPFFMTVATPACHAPFTPSVRHKESFPNTTVYRNPSFNHTTNDKHWIVQMPPRSLPQEVPILDRIQRHRLQSLLAVDEMVEQIIIKLKQLGVYDNTYIIFTSDNGFHIGQFAQPWDKRQPYESDIRVPLLISGPKIPPKILEPYPVAAIDIAPTILDLAGISIPSNIDGESFKTKLLSRNTRKFRKLIFVEYWGESNVASIDAKCPWTDDEHLSQCTVDQWCKCQDSQNNTYVCVLDLSDETYFKLCHFQDDQNFMEAYNLTVDPYELNNIADSVDTGLLDYYSRLLSNFRNRI